MSKKHFPPKEAGQLFINGLCHPIYRFVQFIASFIMRSSTTTESKEVNVTATEAPLTSEFGARVNKAKATNASVTLPSESPGAGFSQNGVVFSTGPAVAQCTKMP
jgi:hypothetical protein